jgi:hypothetical protein
VTIFYSANDTKSRCLYAFFLRVENKGNISKERETFTPKEKWLQQTAGKARQGKARQGKARQGKARQGKASTF